MRTKRVITIFCHQHTMGRQQYFCRKPFDYQPDLSTRSSQATISGSHSATVCDSTNHGTSVGATHALLDLGALNDATISTWRVLAAAIGMVDQTCPWMSNFDCLPKCLGHQRLAHVMINSPANDPAATVGCPGLERLWLNRKDAHFIHDFSILLATARFTTCFQFQRNPTRTIAPSMC